MEDLGLEFRFPQLAPLTQSPRIGPIKRNYICFSEIKVYRLQNKSWKISLYSTELPTLIASVNPPGTYLHPLTKIPSHNWNRECYGASIIVLELEIPRMKCRAPPTAAPTCRVRQCRRSSRDGGNCDPTQGQRKKRPMRRFVSAEEDLRRYLYWVTVSLASGSAPKPGKCWFR